jgi:hypothetical protein
MKKSKLREAIRRAENRASVLRAEVAQLTAEVEMLRKHWRPIPIPHPWQPRNRQCALCDDGEDSPRHGEGHAGE